MPGITSSTRLIRSRLWRYISHVLTYLLTYEDQSLTSDVRFAIQNRFIRSSTCGLRRRTVDRYYASAGKRLY